MSILPPEAVRKWIQDSTPTPVSDTSLDPDAGFVETLYRTCVNLLTDLWRLRSGSISHASKQIINSIDVALFRLWGDNFRPGSLDAVLQDSGYLMTNIIDNLYNIGKVLARHACAVEDSDSIENRATATDVDIDSRNLGSRFRELDILLEKAQIIISNEESSSESESCSSEEADTDSDHELNLYQKFRCHLECPMELAPTLEKRISYLRYKEDQAPSPQSLFQASKSAQPFVLRIFDRFKDANSELVNRLGEANWQRSVRIQGQMQRLLDGRQQLARPNLPDSSTVFKPYSIFHESGLGSAAASRSSYTATVVSHSSFISSIGNEAQGRPLVPPMPYELEAHRPVRCKYCGLWLSPDIVKDHTEWKLHVYADLQAYICTHNHCKYSLKTFPSRNLWADHEFSEHFSQKKWHCLSCDIEIFKKQDFIEHLTSRHDRNPNFRLLQAALSEAEERSLTTDFEKHPCPLCLQSNWATKVAYASHVGRHLEEISLAALPGTTDGGSGSEESSNKGPMTSNIEVMLHEHKAPSPTRSLPPAEFGKIQQMTKINNTWFIPGDGISQEVITADICGYLGRHATARPGVHKDRHGYFIDAHRALTTEMIANLKADSARWEGEKTSGRPPSVYQDMSSAQPGRMHEYFLPGDGISREAISANICCHLGNDALVRPGTRQGVRGYVIQTWRSLTPDIITKLKEDSAIWELQQLDHWRAGAPTFPAGGLPFRGLKEGTSKTTISVDIRDPYGDSKRMELNPRDSAIQVVRLVKDKFKFNGTVVWNRSDIHNGTRISEILLQESTLRIIAESPGQTWRILAPTVQLTPRYTSNEASD